MWRLLLVLAFDDPSFGPSFEPPTATLTANFESAAECESWRRYFFEDPRGSEFDMPGIAPEWYVLLSACEEVIDHPSPETFPRQPETQQLADVLAADRAT